MLQYQSPHNTSIRMIIPGRTKKLQSDHYTFSDKAALSRPT